MKVSELATPALIVDASALDQNLKTMSKAVRRACARRIQFTRILCIHAASCHALVPHKEKLSVHCAKSANASLGNRREAASDSGSYDAFLS